MEWRNIRDYEGIYQVSNKGLVKSLNRIDSAGRHLKGQYLKLLLKDGYNRVTLQCDGKIKHAYVHRLVAECFLENPNGSRIVIHKNGILTDNNVDNLEWGEFYDYLPKQRVFSKKKAVNMYNLNGILLNKFKSITDAVKYMRLQQGHATQTAISAACNEKIKTAYKYIWRWNKISEKGTLK